MCSSHRASAQEPSRFSFQIKTILIIAAVLAGVAAGYAYRHHHRYKHVAVHDPGKIYRAAWVDPDVMGELIDRYEIRTVVNLCAPGEMGEHHWDLERETVRNAGARLLELPMPNTLEHQGRAIQPHLDAIQNPENYPMLVHCQNGIGRTSQFLALYDMTTRGMTAEESLAAQPTFGRPRHEAGVRMFCQRVESGDDADSAHRIISSRAAPRQ